MQKREGFHLNTFIRDATPDDADTLLEIYAYYVEHTAISFECDVPTPEDFRERIRKVRERYPYLVVERDGAIRGYAYASPLKGRAAYDWSCELSIYLDPASRKTGLGRALYEAMEDRLKEMGILNLYACIAWPEREDAYLDRNSAEFHAHLGYRKVGEFHRCGCKFGRWYNIIWMEKLIGEHCVEQPKVKFVHR